MVKYTIDNEKRTNVLYIMAVITIIITPLVNSGISFIAHNVESLSFLEKSFYLNGFLIFGSLLLIVEKHLWKWDILSGIPNLSGEWHGFYIRYDQDKEFSDEEIDTLISNSKDTKQIKVTITQTWQKMNIYWESSNSVSFSTNIDLKIENKKIFLLQWTFDSKDRTGISQKNKYGIGLSTAVIKEQNKFEEIEGTYFTKKLNRGYFKLIKQTHG